MLSDEQMSNGYPFSLLNDEQMSNKVRVEHQPDKMHVFSTFILRCTYTSVPFGPFSGGFNPVEEKCHQPMR